MTATCSCPPDDCHGGHTIDFGLPLPTGWPDGPTDEVEAAQREPATSDTSDGYHTFTELYRYRMLYNAALFNEWAAAGYYDVHKSIRHSGGELCFGGGWFVVYAQLPSGQISNHYEMADWEKFRIPERETAAEWDGHTPQDVATRLAFLLDVQAQVARRDLREVTD